MISIIIPAYNSEPFLAECINSILSQKGLDAGMEVIVIDDGSTDNTGKIADDYALADSRIRVIHTDNQGLSCARNHGINNTRGQYIYFVDADDALLPNSLSLMRSYIETYDVPVIVANAIRSIEMPTKLNSDNSKIQICQISANEAIEKMLYQDNFESSAWAKLYRRDAIANIRFTPGLYYEDLDFNFRFINTCSQVVYINKPVYFYRQHPESFLRQWSDKRLDILHVTDQIENYVNENTPHLSLAAADRKLSANFNTLISATRAGRKDIAANCWQTIKAYRHHSLSNPRVRLKNKVGIVISYLGRHALLAASRIISR